MIDDESELKGINRPFGNRNLVVAEIEKKNERIDQKESDIGELKSSLIDL